MKKHIIILAIAASVILLFNLGAGSLSSWDEAFYAQVSREMHDSGNLVDLTWGGAPWHDKPPLFMWVTSFFYGLFGVSEFSARLFSALAGVGLVLTIYLLAAKLFTKRTGVISAIMALSTYHFLWISRMGMLDVVFTLFVALSIYAFLKSEDHPSSLIFTFLCFSLAFMTKGPGALIIPIILVPYALFSDIKGLLRNKYLWLGALASFIIIGSWYTAAYLHYGKNFVSGHFFTNLVTRTTVSMDGHEGGWLSYINVILYKGKPWGSLGLIIYPFFIYSTLKSKDLKGRLLITWIFTVYLVFTLVCTKLHWYIFPIYPAVMVVAGWGLDRILKKFAMPVLLTVSIISLIYSGTSKGLFTQDYNHDIKQFYIDTASKISTEKVYLYNIHDPGMKFYFGGIGRHVVSEEDLANILSTAGAVIVAPPGDIKKMGVQRLKILTDGSGYFAVKIR